MIKIELICGHLNMNPDYFVSDDWGIKVIVHDIDNHRRCWAIAAPLRFLDKLDDEERNELTDLLASSINKAINKLAKPPTNGSIMIRYTEEEWKKYRLEHE